MYVHTSKKRGGGGIFLPCGGGGGIIIIRTVTIITMYNRSRQLLGRDRSVLSTKQALL